MHLDDDASQCNVTDIIGGEFYDLARDPQEWHDLYTTGMQYREVRDNMTEALLARLQGQRKLTNFKQHNR